MTTSNLSAALGSASARMWSPNAPAGPTPNSASADGMSADRSDRSTPSSRHSAEKGVDGSGTVDATPSKPDGSATLPTADEAVKAETTATTGEGPRVKQWMSSHPLAFLSFLAVLYTLYFARAILLPVALAVVLSLLLRPVVRWMSRRRIPESVGAVICLLSLVVLVSVGIFRLIGPAEEWVSAFPTHLETAGTKLRTLASHFTQISEARAKIEELATGNEVHPLEVQVQQPTLTSNVVLLSTTGSMLASVGLVIVLTYFLLTAGDTLINNVITTLPTFHEKRQIVELIQNVQKGVSSYLFAVTMINVGLGITVGAAMWMIGLPNPALWGLMIALLNFVPYVGALVTGAMIGLVALLRFDSLAYASMAPLVFFAITTIEGQFITPALLGRHMSLNPIMVFLFLTFWGWMWGIGGAVLAVPILAVTRIACDQFERTRPLGTMLSG